MTIMPSHADVFLANECSYCSLLEPIGEYRLRHVNPSRGKRKRKRKRKEDCRDQQPVKEHSIEGDLGFGVAKKPAVHEYLTLGFNSTTRYLEALVPRSTLEDRENQDIIPPIVAEAEASLNAFGNAKPMAAVFVSSTDQNLMLYSHLPLLIKVASLASPLSPTPRLITLPKGADERLSAATSIPRAGLIGLVDGAPEGKSLIDFARRNVPEVEVPWLKEIARGSYRPIKIKTVHISGPLNPENARSSQLSRAEEEEGPTQ